MTASTPIEREALSDAQIDSLWLRRTNIHGGDLMLQLRDFARAIRAEALEEAAKEAVRHTTHPDDPTNEVWQSAYNHVATEIAAAIRALVQPSTGQKT